MSGWSTRRVGFVRGICLLCRLLCIIIAQADASQDHCEKNKSHLLKEIFLICHVQGQDVPKNVNFQNTAGDQKSYPNLPMNMTWERLILLSISKKRPKQQFLDRSSSKSS